MTNFIKKIYKKLLFGYKSSSTSYITFLKKNGIKIGDNVTFYEPSTNYIDYQKGFLIEIGNNVEITRGVTIITHDYAWSVTKQLNGEIYGSREKVTIGNNVFIGINTIILKGVSIGDNVIIGAGSIVNKDVPSNSIICGNPAKVIGNVDEYLKKRKNLYKDEAVKMFLDYYNKYKKIPNKEIFDEFFWLFENRNPQTIPNVFNEKMKLTGNYEKTLQSFISSEPLFKGYDEFVKYCLSKKNNKL